jgi:guanylate kinase
VCVENNIQVIHGLSALKQLTHLNLANNQITKIEHLDLPPLKCLNLSGNMISAIENLDSLKLLQVLDLSNNQISGLRGLEDHPLLHTLDLHGNQISDLGQVTHLLDLGLLASLDLRQNPIQKDDQYRLFYVFSLPWLNNLDGVPVSPEEKVNAKNKFSPSRELMAAKRHMFHVTKALQQPVRLKFSTLTHPSEPYPMLVLCGPLGAGKGYMVRRLVEDFPTYFGLGISHTTRPPREDEQDGREYYFISEDTFTAAEEAGDFLQSQERANYRYGLSVAAVEMVAQHGLACVVHMGIEGALELKSTYFEPRYVLTVPMDSKCHLRRLHRRKCFTQEDMAQAMEEGEQFKDLNRDRPGFFDAIINCDSLDDAYKSLRTLVMEYAGITPNSLVQSTDSIPPSALQRRWVSQGDHDGETDNTPSAQFFSEEEEEDSPETGTTSYTQQSGRSSGTESKNDPDTSTADTSTVLRTAGSMPDTSTGNTSTVIQSTMNSRAGNRPHTSADLPPAENNTKLFTQYEKSTHVGHSPSKFKNIQNVSKSWSRPSTSMSGRSTQSYSKRQTRSESQEYIGSRKLQKAMEAIQSGGIRRAPTTQLSHRSHSAANQSVQDGSQIDQPADHPSYIPHTEDELGRVSVDGGSLDDNVSSMDASSIASGSTFSRASMGVSLSPVPTPSPT